MCILRYSLSRPSLCHLDLIASVCLASLWYTSVRITIMDKSPESEAIFVKISWLFRGKRFKDSSFSWVACVCSAVCNAVNLGFALSFGVLFPELMEYFGETRERTG